jgi:hypothetical protein
MLCYLRIKPGILGLFYGIQNRSFYEDIKENNNLLLNYIFAATALVINVAVKLYSDCLNKEMGNSISVFVIFGNTTEQNSNQVF